MFTTVKKELQDEGMPRSDRADEYAQIFSKPFCGQQFDELRAYYCTERPAMVDAEREPTRRGTQRVNKRSVRLRARIETAPDGVKGKLDAHLRGDDKEQALLIMRVLRYFERYPRMLGGPLPPWETCMFGDGEVGDLVDLTADEIDVESFVNDVLVTKVVKAEPGAGGAALAPASYPVKQEQGEDDFGPPSKKKRKTAGGGAGEDGEAAARKAPTPRPSPNNHQSKEEEEEALVCRRTRARAPKAAPGAVADQQQVRSNGKYFEEFGYMGQFKGFVVKSSVEWEDCETEGSGLAERTYRIEWEDGTIQDGVTRNCFEVIKEGEEEESLAKVDTPSVSPHAPMYPGVLRALGFVLKGCRC